MKPLDRLRDSASIDHPRDSERRCRHAFRMDVDFLERTCSTENIPERRVDACADGADCGQGVDDADGRTDLSREDLPQARFLVKILA